MTLMELIEVVDNAFRERTSHARLGVESVTLGKHRGYYGSVFSELLKHVEVNSQSKTRGNEILGFAEALMRLRLREIHFPSHKVPDRSL